METRLTKPLVSSYLFRVLSSVFLFEPTISIDSKGPTERRGRGERQEGRGIEGGGRFCVRTKAALCHYGTKQPARDALVRLNAAARVSAVYLIGIANSALYRQPWYPFSRGRRCFVRQENSDPRQSIEILV